jgi:hypothetical protein
MNSWPLKMVLIICPETSWRNSHHALRNNPKERSSHPLCGGSLKSRSLLLVECCFSNGTPGLNFRCTSYAICSHGTQTAEIFHILRLLLTCRNLQCGRWPYLRCFHIHFQPNPQHRPISISLSILPAAPSLPYRAAHHIWIFHTGPFWSLQTLQ